MSDTIGMMTETARQSPEAAGLVAAIMDQNARDREEMLPTWEMFEHERDAAYDRGFEDGRAVERRAITGRLFGWADDRSSED